MRETIFIERAWFRATICTYSCIDVDWFESDLSIKDKETDLYEVRVNGKHLCLPEIFLSVSA